MGPSGGSGVEPLAFTSGNTLTIPEGDDYDYTVSVNRVCDFSIVGGADGNQHQLIGAVATTAATLRAFARAYAPGGDNDGQVILRATDVATGEFVEQTISETFTDVAAPSCTTPATVAATTGAKHVGSTLTATPGVWVGARSVTGVWRRGGVAISGATSLNYVRTEADLLAGGAIDYFETASGAGGTNTQASSNTLPATSSGVLVDVSFRNTNAGAFAGDPAYVVPGSLATDTAAAFATKTPASPAGLPTGQSDTGSGAAYKLKVSKAGIDRSSSAPAGLRGQLQISSGTDYAVFELPAGVNLKMQCAIGDSATTSNQAVRVYDGDFHLANGADIPTLQFAAQSVLDTQLVGADGVKTNSYPNWATDSAKVTINVTNKGSGLGALSFARHSSGTVTSLMRVRIFFAEYDLNYSSANLAGNIAYSDTSASDTTGLGTVAAPFQHIIGDPAAGGVVSGFTLTPGAWNKLQGNQTFRPASYTGRGGVHLVNASAGTSGNPIKFGSYGTGSGIVDGSVLLTGMAAPASGDAGWWENPNHASLLIKTGLTGPKTPFIDGEDWMFPAQYPNPTNPADYTLTYPGNDSFIALNQSEFNAQVVEDLDNTCNADGSAGAGGYHKVKVTGNTLIAARYNASTRSLNDHTCAIKVVGNRIEEFTIKNHNTGTGYFEVIFPDWAHVFQATPDSGDLLFAIRYHPYDCLKVGQYAYNAAGTVGGGWFATATRGRLSSDINYLVKFSANYQELDGLVLRRGGYNGAAVADGDSGSSQIRTAIALRNVTIEQCIALGRIIRANCVTGSSRSTFSLQNVTIKNIQGSPGIQWDADGGITGLTIRDCGGTGLLIQTAPSTTRTITDYDCSDLLNIHGNGLAIYSKAANWTATHVLGMNIGIPLSTQQDGSVAARNITLKDSVYTGRRGFGAFASASIWWWQFGDKETNLLAEGLLIPGPITYGYSTGGTNAASTGGMVKNCVLGFFVAQVDVAGLTFQDCLFMCLTSGGGGISNDTDLVNKGGNNGGGNVYLTPGSTTWTGCLTIAMQQALTKDHGLSTYTQRNIGLSTGKTWIVPAYGTAFSLTDVWLTTSSCRARYRAGLDFACVGGTKPGSSLSLPAGQGNNSLFALNNGYVSWVSNAVAGSYSIVIRETCVHPNVNGGSGTTRDTTIVITVT